MSLKDLFAKVKAGEELTDAEEAEVEKADTEAQEAEVEKKVDELAAKVLARMDEKQKESDPIIDTKSITADKVKAMSDKERTDAFFKALVHNDHNALSMLQEKTAYMNEGNDAHGGYLVPDQTFGEVVDALSKIAVMRPNARVIQNCPAHLDVTSMTGLGTAYWRGEAAKKQSSTVKFGTQALTPYTVTVIVKLTNELAKDSMLDITRLVIDAITETILQEEELVFAAGNGSGKPSGLEHYYASYSSSHKVLNATYGDLGDRCMAADSMLLPRYRQNAKWYMPTTQLTKIRVLRATANGMYLFQPDPTGQFPGLINGKPVMINDNLTNIWYGDLNQAYWIGQNGGLSVAQSTEATVGGDNLFEQNMFAIRVEERIDGEIVNQQALIAIEAE